MIALTAFWTMFMFLLKAALTAFGACLALMIFGVLFVAVLLSAISNAAFVRIHVSNYH